MSLMQPVPCQVGSLKSLRCRHHSLVISEGTPVLRVCVAFERLLVLLVLLVVLLLLLLLLLSLLQILCVRLLEARSWGGLLDSNGRALVVVVARRHILVVELLAVRR